jgi:hypothetical protein
MILPSTKARRQLERFLTALFLPDEIVELRFIESWMSRGRKKSRVVRSAEWLRPHDFLSQHTELTSFAKQSRTNIYCGVCPRARKGDSHDDSIQTVRCVWCDVDRVTAEQADNRWREAGIPRPSLVVGSGSGIHGYWLLERDLQTMEDRLGFAAMLPHFYRSFGGDHVQNLSRILRPPGTMNFKDARNGRPPLPCKLLTCNAKLHYPLQAFSPWIRLAESKVPSTMSSRSSGSRDPASRAASYSENAKVIELVSRLDRPSSDRSRRDFAIVCDLIRLGLAHQEIWELVRHTSKFESNGRAYFDHTITNAERRVRLDSMLVGGLEAST